MIQNFGLTEKIVRREYENFVKDDDNPNLVDIDSLLEVERHSKIYGIIPDTESKKYL